MYVNLKKVYRFRKFPHIFPFQRIIWNYCGRFDGYYGTFERKCFFENILKIIPMYPKNLNNFPEFNEYYGKILENSKLGKFI